MLWSLFKKETKSDVIQEDRNHIQIKELETRILTRKEKLGFRDKNRIDLSFAPLTLRASHPLSKGLHTPISRTQELWNFN